MKHLTTRTITPNSHPGTPLKHGFGWGVGLTLLALTWLGGCGEGELDLSSLFDAGQQPDDAETQRPDGGETAQVVDAGVQPAEKDDALDDAAAEDDALDDAAAEDDAVDAADDAVDAADDALDDANNTADVEQDASEPEDEGGATDEDAQTDADDDTDDVAETPEDDAKRMPVIVASGANHQLTLSIDDGRTWCLTHEDSSLSGFDNAHLLRNVTFANGYFVAGSWEGLYRSRNGYDWEDVLEQTDNADRPPFGQWIAEVNYGNGWWVATGGAGTAMRSRDLLTWEVTGLPGGEAARSLAFGNGKFVTGRDGDTWWESSDGVTWTQLGSGTAALIFDGEAFRASPGYDCAQGGLTCMAPQWGKPFKRSEDGGQSWTELPGARFTNESTRFAFGEAPASDFEAGAGMNDALRGCLGL